MFRQNSSDVLLVAEMFCCSYLGHQRDILAPTSLLPKAESNGECKGHRWPWLLRGVLPAVVKLRPRVNGVEKLISIIVPTYNCGAKLAGTIESVLAEPTDLFEILVMDGASDHETLRTIEKYRDSLTVISEKDRGVYDAMNKGIRHSSGKYLLFLGAGDRLRQGVLARISTRLPKRDLCFVYGDTYLVRRGEITSGPFSIEEFKTKNICHQAIFYERTLFRRLGKYNLKYRICADWVFNMQCFADRRVSKIYLDEVVVDFEGWGISETQTDLAFEADQPELIERYVNRNDRDTKRALSDVSAVVVSGVKTLQSQFTSLLRRSKS